MPDDYLNDLIARVKEDKKRGEKEKKKPKALESVLKKREKVREETKKLEENLKKLESGLKTPGKKLVAIEEEPVPEIKEEDVERIPEALEEDAGEEIHEDAPIKSTSELEVAEASKKVEIASYGKVKIYKIPGKPMLYYMVPVPRPTATERAIIATIKEAATRLISITPYRIRDPEQKRVVYKQRIMEILKSSPELHIPERRMDFYAEAVVRDMVGYGLIDILVRDDKLEEIMIIGPKRPVYIFHREYEMMATNIEFYSETEIEDLINKIARQIGRRVDISSPLLDARLPDGSRVNATIPPASISGGTLTIRKFREEPYSLVDLISLNTLGPELAAFLWLAVEGLGARPANILISGGTGSGKTTTLNVLASFIPERERIVTIEDTAELNLPIKHWIQLEARPPGLEGKGEVTMDVLTKNSLRMRPDRIIVGEVRHAEAFSLFTAMNTGHDGCLGTVHANSPQETIVRVTSPPMNVPEIMLSGLDLIIVQHRLHDKKKGTIRRFTEVAEVSGVLEGRAQTQSIFERNPYEDTIHRTEVPSRYLKKLQEFAGMTKKQVDDELGEREEFLKNLVKKNVRSISDVSRAAQSFLMDKRET